MRPYLTESEVAAGLRRSLAGFRRDWHKLRGAGFPRPAPVKSDSGERLFDPEAIRRWQDRFIPILGGAAPAIPGQPKPALGRAAVAANDAAEDPDTETGDPVGDLLARRGRSIAERG